MSAIYDKQVKRTICNYEKLLNQVRSKYFRSKQRRKEKLSRLRSFLQSLSKTPTEHVIKTTCGKYLIMDILLKHIFGLRIMKMNRERNGVYRFSELNKVRIHRLPNHNVLKNQKERR